MSLGFHQWLGAAPTDLGLENAHHVTFKEIPPSRYETLAPDSIRASVAKSASALVLPFAKERQLTTVTLNIKHSGSIGGRTPEKEKTKKGDDAYFRIGVMRAGSAPMVPFFAPAWIKAVAEVMILPSDRMEYLIPLASSPAGTKWENPYSSSIQSVAMPCSQIAPEEFRCEYRFETPQNVVGLWFMADGDNTQSTFVTTVSAMTFS